MNVGLGFLTENVGMSFMNIILLLLVCGNLLFWAIKFELGNLILLLMSATVFIASYAGGYNYVPAAVVLMISIILMAFSVVMSTKTEGVYLT